MEVVRNSYMPGDPRLVEQLVYELKSQGIFDQFRKECISDVDTKPAYQNLRQRVEGSVTTFLKQQTWRPDMNKNQVREQLRKNIYESGYLDTGVERIVDQVVNPKINTIFLPQVEDVVYRYLGIEKPNRSEVKRELKVDVTDLLPTDLEAISPESDHTKEDSMNFNDSLNSGSKMDEDESPPFEPIDVQVSNVQVQQEENSVDSHLSGFSGLQSHDSNPCPESKISQMDLSNQDSQVSQNSSDSRLSLVTIVTSDDNTKMEIREDSNSKLPKSNDSNSPMEISTPDAMETIVDANSVQQDDIQNSMDTSEVDNGNDTFDETASNKQENEVVREIENDTAKKLEEEGDKNVEKDVDRKLEKGVDKTIESPQKKQEEKQNEDKNCNEKKSDDKRSRNSDKYNSKDKKDDKHRKSSSSISRDKEKSSSKYTSSSKDKSKSKDKHLSRSSSSSSKDKDRIEKERDRNGKDKDKNEKDKNINEKDKERNEKDKERNGKDKDKNEKDKERNEKDKVKTEKDKDRNEKDGSKNDRDKNKNSKERDRGEKEKDKDKKERDKDKLSARNKEKSTKDKERSSSTSKHSNSKGKEKTSAKSDSSKKDKEKSQSSSLNSSKDIKLKSSHSDSKSKSSSSDKHKRDDKGAHKQSSSSSASKRNKDKKKDSKKDAKDDHYSSKDKKNDRRSTDRDSNDGRSGRQGHVNSFGDNNSSQTQKSSQESSNSNSGSGSGDSGTSDQSEHTIQSPIKVVEHMELSVTLIDKQKLKYMKPKFASNFQEARKLMKIRKQLAKLERQNQLSLTQIEMPKEVPLVNGICSVEKSVIVEGDTEKDQVKEEEFVEESKTPKVNVTDLPEKNREPIIESRDLSKENWEALEARLAQEMSNVNYNSYETYDDYDYGTSSSNVTSPKKINSKHAKDTVECESITLKEEAKTVDQADKTTESVKTETENDQICSGSDVTEPVTVQSETNINVTIVKEEEEQHKDITDSKLTDTVDSKMDVVGNAGGDSGSEACVSLEPFSPCLEKNLQFLYKYIEKLEQDVRHSLKTVQNNFVKRRCGKRKLVVNVDLRNNNNKSHYEQTIEVKRSRRSVVPNLNSVITKANKEKLCNSSDISPNDSFSLPLSPAESDKSNDKKEEEPPKAKPKRESVGRSINLRSQRYSSEDLYKPRPIFASSRRSRGAKNFEK